MRIGYLSPKEESDLGIYKRPVCHNGVLIWSEFRRFMCLLDAFLGRIGRIGRLGSKAWLN